jgi:hypothetical protein
MTPAPREIPDERWVGDLSYLREIPYAERPRWRLSPPEMTFAAAHRWARDEVRADKMIRLATGETLVRLRLVHSPWELPPPVPARGRP